MSKLVYVPRPEHRRLLSRPLAQLQRDAGAVLRRGGSALKVADFSVSEPSIFRETPELLQRLSGLGTDLERRAPPKSDGKNRRRSMEARWQPPEILDVTGGAATKSEISAPKLLGSSQIQSEIARAVPAKTGGIGDLLRKYGDFQQSGVDPDVKERVAEVLRLAVPPNTSLEKRERMRKLFAIDHSVESLLSSGQASVENFNVLIRALSVRGKLDEALAVPEKMEALGFAVDQETVVSCIVACGKDAALARQVFLKFRAQAITADSKIYGALMKAHAQAGDVASVGALLRKAEDEDVAITLPMWTTLLATLVRTGATEEAVQEFNRVRTWKGVQPDSVLFTVMLKSCVKNAECERALNIFDDLQVSGCLPTDVTYMTLMAVMAQRRDFAKKTFEFFDRMQCEEFPITKSVATSLLTACASLGNFKLFRKFSEQIMAAGLPFSRDFFLLGIRTCAEAMTLPNICRSETSSYVRIANELVSNMCDRGLAVNTSVLNGLMEVYQKAGLVDEALLVLDDFQHRSLLPNKRTFQIMFALFAAHRELHQKFFALFEEYPAHRSAAVIRTALDLAIASRSANKVSQVLAVMQHAAVFPSPTQAEQLAKAGRKVVEIHEAVAALVHVHKLKTNEAIKKRDQLAQLDMREHEIRLAKIGKSTSSPTPAQQARDSFFDKLKKITGGHSRPFLPLAEYHQLTKRGGELYAKKKDRPAVNRLLL